MKKKVTMPKELRLVVKVKAKPGYQIECTFDNEVVKSYDMSFVTKKSGSMLVPFKNESFFKKVFLEMGTPLDLPSLFRSMAFILFETL